MCFAPVSCRQHEINCRTISTRIRKSDQTISVKTLRPLSATFLAIILLVAAVTVFSQEAKTSSKNASPLPAPTGFVNDFAGVIDEPTKQALEQKLRAFKEKTAPSAELAVVVVRTTGDRPIFDYSLAVARGWGIGSKEDDNPSALLMIAVDDRKYFTQVSRDLEDDLPDGVVGSLQRQFLVPEFRRQNYAKGISDTLDAYMATIERKGGVGAPTAEEKPATGPTESIGGGALGTFCCFAIGLVILVMIFGRSGKGPTSGHGSRWGGGAFGGGGRRESGIADALPWIIGGVIGSGGSSSSSDWGGSSGGSSWGGFGGGGDFGGGGAGGDW